MDFYERVKNLVKEHGLLLTPFLQSIGINYETYKSARRMNNLPRADEAVAIAEALDTTVEFLVTGKNKTRGKPELLEALEELEQMVKNS